MKTYKFKIEGLDCANCTNNLERELSKIEILSDVTISFMREKLSFSCEESNYEEAVKLIRKVIKREEPDVNIKEL